MKSWVNPDLKILDLALERLSSRFQTEWHTHKTGPCNTVKSLKTNNIVTTAHRRWIGICTLNLKRSRQKSKTKVSIRCIGLKQNLASYNIEIAQDIVQNYLTYKELWQLQHIWEKTPMIRGNRNIQRTLTTSTYMGKDTSDKMQQRLELLDNAYIKVLFF